ncbi:MAG: GspMb/PilO family protein [Planctomycetota bacterium]
MRFGEHARTAAAALAAAATVAGALYVPTLWQRGQTLARAVQARAEIQLLGRPNIQAAENELTLAREDFESERRQVTLGPSPESALAALADAAHAADLLDYSVATRAAVDAPHGARAIPLEVVAVGGFQQGFEILQQIEKAPRLIRVDRLTMTDLESGAREDPQDTDELSAPRVQTTLQLSAFFQPEGGAP